MINLVKLNHELANEARLFFFFHLIHCNKKKTNVIISHGLFRFDILDS